jgi:glycosyltransferase involved in cell wall biosynthesis
MRIGFIGNTNNYPFMLARAMRKLGHEVQFIVSSSDPLERPEYRYADISYPYPAWIHDLSPIRLRDIAVFGSSARRRILKVLRGCDAIVANSFGPALLSDLKLPSIALLTGSDLYAHASLDAYKTGAIQYGRFPAFFRSLTNWIYVTRLALPQRAGIRSAAGVVYFPRGILPSSDRLLDELGVGEDRRIFNAMTDFDELDYVPPPLNKRMRIFCGARLSWTSLTPEGGKEVVDYKGAEIMIRGLALFVRTSGVPIEIRLVKKGLHVRETIQLAEDLGLKEHLTVLNEMTQKQVIDEYGQADVVFDQLGRGTIGMVSLDAMACGRPVIANARPEILEPIIGAPSPVCQASAPEEVSQQLALLHFNPAERERIGLASRKYVELHCSTMALAERCLKKLLPAR